MALQIHPDRQSFYTLPLAQICLNDQVQQRVALDPEKVVEYSQLYRDGHDLGPLVVFTDGQTYLLADGFHRVQAAALAALLEVPVVVHDGTLREAILYATSCNLHGQPLTNADKRKRVQTLLADPEWAQWSDNSIARHCGVAHSFVSKIREALSLDSESSEGETVRARRTYRDRYGQVRTMDTSAIGHQPVLDGPSAAVLAPAPPILTEVLDPEPPAPVPSTLQQTSSGDYEWYTPLEVLPLVKAVLGEIDVDPASCVAAQKDVQARTYYTRDDDGLRQPWSGTVFCNPPYKMPEVARFIGKLCEELDAQRTTEAILLVNSATETDWFQRAFARADAVCFPDGRMHFWHATRSNDHPCQGQTLLYYGPDPAGFCRVFAGLGVSTRVRVQAAESGQLALEEAAPPERTADAILHARPRRRTRQPPPVPYETHPCATPGCGRRAHSHRSDDTYHCCPTCALGIHVSSCDEYEARRQTQTA